MELNFGTIKTNKLVIHLFTKTNYLALIKNKPLPKSKYLSHYKIHLSLLLFKKEIYFLQITKAKKEGTA